MPGPDLPELPASFKSIQPYLKVASEHDQRDPVVSYWARLYALQTAMKLGSKGPEERVFLIKLMDWLETAKKEHHDNEAVTNEVAAQAHLENWALKLFLYADKNDRAANFNKNVIQSFYTAGLLYDVLSTFGELTDEAVQNRKYAKWKAAYIHNCLKNGETPVPGPVNSEDDEAESGVKPGESIAQSPQPTPPPRADPYGFPSPPGATNPETRPAPPGIPSYPNLPQENSTPQPYNPPSTPIASPSVDYSSRPNTGGVALTSEQMTKVSKYIKWAGSAVNYDDVPTAVQNLQKALHLLTTGQDS